MRGLIYSVAVTLGLMALPQAAHAVVVWQGEAVVTAASGTCTFPGDERRNVQVGTVLKSVLRPRAISDNGGSTRIAFVHDSGAMFVMVTQDVASGDFARVGVTHSGELIKTGFGNFANYTQSPVTITANTPFVRVSATVEDFMFLSGCDATFRATYSKR